MTKQIPKEELEQKIKNFRRTNELDCFMDLNFEDTFLRLPVETKDGHVVETTFCYGYKEEKYLLAASVQAGCVSGCKFCGIYSLQRDLTETEIIDELALLISTAEKRGYNVFDRPLKATFVNGGDALDNYHFSKVLEIMKDELPIQTKISTVFPGLDKNLDYYGRIVEAAKDYPNIVQFQVSLNSTNEKYRQSLVNVPLADFRTIRKAGELWFEKVSNARKIDLSFTLHEKTPMDVDAIKDILPPEIFAIRLRDYKYTENGEKYKLKEITGTRIDDLKDRFRENGYYLIPGLAGDTEKKFKLAPGETIKLYDKIRDKSLRLKMSMTMSQ